MLSDKIKNAALKISRESKSVQYDDIEYKGKTYSVEATVEFDTDYQGSSETGWDKFEYVSDVDVENVVVKDDKGDVIYEVWDDNDMYDGVKGKDVYDYIRDYISEMERD